MVVEGTGAVLDPLELVGSVDEGTALVDVAMVVDDSDADELYEPDPEAVVLDAVDLPLLLDWLEPELPSVVTATD